LDNNLATALEYHRAGLLDPARRMHQNLLVRQPNNADALHLLGVLQHQCGQYARAAELIGRAIARNPAAPAYHANLAEVYRALGRLDRAVGACRATARRKATRYQQKSAGAFRCHAESAPTWPRPGARSARRGMVPS
jgi:predicted Zn-dependent protease